ncbi:methylated-DNA-[protein]-cysteine S-methyltransferase [Azospirillum fermentarium]|uniref:methylated-DNA--[protein]-cysteine S-methyltransferase n=1 Tax=Azospirillum fermentarium TaxID=1233114 RepID=UPI002226F26D|nr:methylated-DNA--[protein]-cysteine S-methyltransferase [Azospirillum fermentarium]MCW2245077.1 methylated-DNA-[protein]-cysteine S-methyltransferase [Azospirillum fermentarium]
MTARRITIDSPLGPLTITARDGAVTVLDWGGGDGTVSGDPLLDEAAAQLDAYFTGRLQRFDLPLQPAGTAFQRRVWDLMLTIPYGQTWTYGTMARHLGSAARAVGGACGRNPIPIIIPCHRVVGGGTSPGGYSGQGGLITKAHLLDLERRHALQPAT